MDREQVFKQLNDIFQDVFDDKSIIVSDETTANDIEDWDSLEHVNLIVAVERHFNIKFTMNEMIKFKNVGNMVDKILEKL